ncbi:AAA family ATPase [Crossiella sp. SN42]|uniref:AAA family ATPase n=1 Tax=Crossiella sp. SN42 TaxID=2944808 RepID=UPI00207CC5B8|nr:AAA family ATPase [Crossiella sp. SN42]MCO1581649.1 AAA family ATPase [Crossiella sp. SN42]
MAGQTLNKRLTAARVLWQSMDELYADVLEGDNSLLITLHGQFVQDNISAQLTKVCIEVTRAAGFHTVKIIEVAQPVGGSTYCAECQQRPCQHHRAVLEAGAKLAGAAGATLRVTAGLPDDDLVPAGELPSSSGGARRFFSVDKETWEEASPVLSTFSLPFQEVTEQLAPELAGLVPDLASLAGAVTNDRACAQIANLSRFGRSVFLLAGPPGTAKSASLARIAAIRKVPYLTINSPEQAELFRVGLTGGATKLEHSLLVKAIQGPCVVEFVDLHHWMDRLEVLDALEPLLNPSATRLRAYYPIENGAIDVPIHPGALVAVTTNRPSADISEKWMSRWTAVPFGQPDVAALQADAVQAGTAMLDHLIGEGVVTAAERGAALSEIDQFAQLTVQAVAILNQDHVLAARHTWGTRSAREAVTRRVMGQQPNEIAAAVFAGKLLRDPSLALRALATVHNLQGWGQPKITDLPFRESLTAEQLKAAFPAHEGALE